jgi:TatA/E family protein of Tat protein translocase
MGRFDRAGGVLYDAREACDAPQMLSIPHLIVIFIVALVVFGPEKLPELARMLGKAMGEVRKVTAEMRGTFEDHMRELERETAQRGQESPAAKAAAVTQASVPQASQALAADVAPPEAARDDAAPATQASVPPGNDPPTASSASAEPEKTKDGDNRPA